MRELLPIYHPEIPAFLREFAQTPPLRRLRDVGMNCGCEYTRFPRFTNCGPYSRFDHSLGVALILWHFTGDIAQSLAGLFHDVATPVFAHVVDFLHGDHLRQESTEEGTEEWIAGNRECRRLLKQYGLTLEQVSDYHIYPVADNPAPALSADRLEYTLGNLWNYRFESLDTVRQFYEDLTVGQDERGKTELVFRTPELAGAFMRAALQNSRVYVADEDRFAMETLARILRTAVDRGVLSERDLWTTETEVIAHLEKDEVCGEAWRQYRQYSKILRCDRQTSGGNWLQVDAKKRWIDPLAEGRGRVSCWDAEAGRLIADFRNLSFDHWVGAE